METKAQLNMIHLAPRKVRAVANLVKHKDVGPALDQLRHMVRKPTDALAKLIQSSIANAENNHQMVRDNLYIKDIVVNEGVKLRRAMPRAFGRSYEIQKKTSLITVILDEKVPGLKRKVSAKAEEKQAKEHKHDHDSKKPEVKEDLTKKSTGVVGNLKRKMFQRKSI